jgi:hypothetical protein
MKFIDNGKGSELERFARWFHQDFGVERPGVDEFALAYFRSLSVQRRRALGSELGALLKHWPGRNGRGLRNAWVRLGANWVERGPALRSRLSKWAEELQ